MTNKRPTIKGKGADLFLGEGKNKVSEQGKATFYFPKTLINELDEVWLELRSTHKKLKKSEIAQIALEELLQNYREQHQDSTLAKHLNI